MQIFQKEIADGLKEVLSAKACISYASLVEPSSTNSCSKNYIKTIAGLEDKDLYYTQSILVTTSWNKNDDVFDKDEVWAARQTPVHKPTNLEHDEKVIVGHITANWPITEEGVLIDPATPTENIPTKFHILTGSVIYTGFTDPELKERASKLISEIENGTKYVSMECFFEGFDYGVEDLSTGEYKVLARTEETSFLTKYLRAYGGVGEHQNHKIGRVLRNITFSGKGFVDRPANPESIIFTKHSLDFNKKVEQLEKETEKKDAFENQGVFSIQANFQTEEINMSENEVIEQAAPVVEEVVATDCSEAVAAASADLTAKNEELVATLSSLEAELAEIKSTLEATASASAAEKENLQQELAAANETLAGYKAEVEKFKKKEKNMKRQAALLDAGVEAELAAATVEKFESLDDASFDHMTEVFAAVKKKKEEDKKGDMEDEAPGMEEKDEASTVTKSSDAEVLETAEPEACIDLSVGGESEASEIETTRAALVDFVCNRLGKKL